MNIFRVKLIRWKYVLPRLAIVLVLGLVVRFGLDPALKWGLQTGGEASVGAKVELAALRTSLFSGELVLEDLAVANPQSPMRNLLEAGESRLQIDMNALLHGHIVVQDGTISDLKFDTDRETSGTLAEAEAAENAGPSIFDPLVDRAGEMGLVWFDQLSDRLNADITDQLQSPRLAKELQERWPQQYDQLRQQVDSIRTRGRELEKSIREVKKNPLRGLQRLPKLQAQLKATQAEVQSVQRKIGDLPRQAEADRTAILAAREQDEALIRKQLQIGSLDEEGLTQTLLGGPVSQGLASALGWISWAREQVPGKSMQPKKLRSRGSTVLFTKPQPGYLIKQLQLQGSAQFNGQPLQLVGTLTDVSDAPHLVNEPTRLKLRGSEALDISVEIVLDRRGAVAADHLRIDCPQLTMAQRTLGNKEKLSIEVSPGVAHLEIDLTFNGDQLEGQIVFVQDSLQLTPQLANSKSKQLSTALAQAMSGVQRLEANITLAGTLKKPQVKIDSDIGSQVATGLNSAVKQLIQSQSDALLAKTRKQVDQQLEKLTQMREEAQEKLLAQLGEDQKLLSQLASLAGGGGQGFTLPGIIPQLGKSLRPGTQQR